MRGNSLSLDFSTIEVVGLNAEVLGETRKKARWQDVKQGSGYSKSSPSGPSLAYWNVKERDNLVDNIDVSYLCPQPVGANEQVSTVI